MGLLDNLNPFSAISKAVFGDKGISGGVMDVLAQCGVKEKLTPEEQQKADDALRQWETDITNADNAVIVAVNTTMQAEAKSEHWMQWAWRPFFGFTAAGVVIWNYIAAPMFHYAIIPIPSDTWNVMLAVLGVTAATRGWEKIVKAKGDIT